MKNTQKYNYIVHYKCRESINIGEIGTNNERDLEKALSTALARIGTSLIGNSRVTYEDGCYTVYTHRFAGYISLENREGKRIQFPKGLHDKLLKG